MEPPPPGTVVLRPQPWVRLLAPALAVFFAVVAVSAHRGRTDLPGVVAWVVVGVAGLLALAMAYAAWSVPRRSVHVTAQDVAVFRGERETCRLRFNDLTEVRPYLTARQRLLRSPRHALALRGTTTAGAERTLRVFDLAPGLRPLLDVLEPVVAARPELVRGERERRLLRLFLAEVPPVPRQRTTGAE